ncbi:DNA-directed RNA polymerase subunit beta' [Ureaplasma ceti]|uniref:DNA-directed RNA polymerase subunit beta' n=1 Tax=Ureaplasma ceti TaxID=3119530 RepID=A0ABP9U5Z8_9BACT
MQNNQKQSNIKALKIGIASPERIRGWSHGEVTKSETINYKSLKPESGGLFDEAIFGPVKDYECACGKYKKVKFKGKKCEKCGVDITDSIVRRERMGHIELASPVAHIWMTKELPNPSKISLLLDISYKEVEQVVYFVNYIILDEGHYEYNGEKLFRLKEIVDLSSAKHNAKTRTKLRRILKDIQDEIVKEHGREHFDYKRAVTYDLTLAEKNLPFSIQEVFKFITKYTGIKFGVGAAAIQELLKNIDLDKEYDKIKADLKEYNDVSNAKARKLLSRLETVKWLKESGNKPEWMVMNVVPVTPPDTRPIIQLDGGRFTTSDINNFYRKIIIRNDRLKKLSNEYAPDILMNNERRMLQEAVDALFDNSSRKKPVVGRDRRPLKSLSNHLKGKQGLFRQNLLGKRVDYSGRSVIVIGPELKMYEVGIPVLMILKLFKPFIIHELIKKYDDEGNEVTPYVTSIRQAENMITRQEDVIWPIVQKVIKTRPVLLNRAPTLHRLGIQAFEVKMTDGKAIRLHPLVTTAFNADFDGDQMAVHVPLGKEAIAEARSIMLASWHILGPKDGKPIITPTQDMVLGNYYITREIKGVKGEGLIFNDQAEVKRALATHKLDIHALIGISTKAYPAKEFIHDGILITTPGKIIFNETLPTNFPYVNDAKFLNGPTAEMIATRGQNVREMIQNHTPNKPFGKKALSSIINNLYIKYSDEPAMVPEIMDKIKSLGFYYSMISATSISAFDVPMYDKKYEYFEKADKKVLDIKHYAEKGWLNDDERYTKVVELWSKVKDKVTTDIAELVNSKEYESNSIVIMADSGARGNISNFTQLAGMRGLMSKSYNYDQKRKSKVIKDTIEIPIKHSFIEGLTVSEYFNSSYGARKGMTDTAMKTSKSGYMTRKLVDSTQEVIITDVDCHATRGLKVEAIVDTKDQTTIEPLVDRIVGRRVVFDLYDEKGVLIIKAGDLITPQVAKIIEANHREVEVRSPLHCQSENGICQHCFGLDLSTNKEIKRGTTIGVIAAQSIGEPGTQLTMRTFHTGGVAGGSNITQGFERLKQLFDCIPPKPWEKSTICEINGSVTSIDYDAKPNTIVVIVANELEEIEYDLPLDAKLRVEQGDKVCPGSKISEGSIDVNELLKVAGIDKVRDYLIKEVQKVYRTQGIEISDKYIEVIVRQLTTKVKVVNPGDSDLFIGEIISINEFRRIAQELLSQGKVPPMILNQVFGLDNAPAMSGSFLSAASFQDTKKTLTDAAARAQVDYLAGLKENVILGNLIPAGTGLEDSETILAEGLEMMSKEY